MQKGVRFRQGLALVIVCVLTVTLLGGCSRQASHTPATDQMNTGRESGFLGNSGKASSSDVTPTSEQTIVDRKIVMNASISLDVADAEKTVADCEKLAEKLGGYVAESSLRKSDDRVVGSVTVRIPAATTAQALQELAALGTVTSRSSGSQDVTAQYIDIEARLKVLRAEEEQLLGFLKKAGTIKDMLAVQEQLGTVRTEIEQYEGQQRYLDNATSLATVSVELVQTVAVFVSPRGFGEAFVESLVRFGHGLATFWTWLGGAIVYLVFYGLLLWGGTLLVRKVARRRPGKPLPPAT